MSESVAVCWWLRGVVSRRLRVVVCWRLRGVISWRLLDGFCQLDGVCQGTAVDSQLCQQSIEFCPQLVDFKTLSGQILFELPDLLVLELFLFQSECISGLLVLCEVIEQEKAKHEEIVIESSVPDILEPVVIFEIWVRVLQYLHLRPVLKGEATIVVWINFPSSLDVIVDHVLPNFLWFVPVRV